MTAPTGDAPAVPGRTVASIAGRRSRRGRAWVVGTAVVSGVFALTLNRNVTTTEPVFATVNVITMITVITLGAYLMVRHGEVFSGGCFAVAGLSWSLTVLDSAFPTWGPYAQWNFSGVTYAALGWAILRYRRRRLLRAEKVFVVLSVVLTVGISFVSSFVVPPTALGYPSDTFWPLLTTSTSYVLPSFVGNALAFLALAAYFSVLMVRTVRTAPTMSRAALRPMAFFGGSLALGTALLQSAAMLTPHAFSPHLASTAGGSLVIALSGALAASMVLQQVVSSRFVTHLPMIRTPETVATYLHTVTGDDSAELLYWLPESNRLIDAQGRPQPIEPTRPSEYLQTWVTGSDGARVAVLRGDGSLAHDPGTLEQLVRVLSIVAENARLNVVLRMQVVELAATRTAEKLAFDKAREEFHRNLHDGVQQTIAAVRMDLDGLRDLDPADPPDPLIDDIDEKLLLALDQVHSLKRGVDPPELRFGLKPAIERTVAQLRLDATCRVVEADLGVMTLPVYYLVRESLTNVHKHARASEVGVEVSTDGRTIAVTVRDDGPGGAVLTTKGGIGGMQQRVEQLGGRLVVASEPGCGTTVSASIPLISP